MNRVSPGMWLCSLGHFTCRLWASLLLPIPYRIQHRWEGQEQKVSPALLRKPRLQEVRCRRATGRLTLSSRRESTEVACVLLLSEQVSLEAMSAAPPPLLYTGPGNGTKGPLGSTKNRPNAAQALSGLGQPAGPLVFRRRRKRKGRTAVAAETPL